MPAMHIILEGDNAWPDLRDKPDGQVIHLQNTIEVTALEGGMQSGRTSVAFRFDLPDGRSVLAETSLALFLNAARAFQLRYPNG